MVISHPKLVQQDRPTHKFVPVTRNAFSFVADCKMHEMNETEERPFVINVA